MIKKIGNDFRGLFRWFISIGRAVGNGMRLNNRHKRSVYTGADTGNFRASWGTTNYSGNSELYNSLSALRARSRELNRNNSYGHRFFQMVPRNVIGRNGNNLQSRVMNGKELDQKANDKIENAWVRWGKKENCDVTGMLSFRDMQHLIIRTIARDGEVLIYKIRNADNPFQFSLQLIEADHLDEKYNDTLSNGNVVKMGVELNEFGKPVAYHIYSEHPGDTFYATRRYGERVRIPAEDMIHLFIKDRISVNRGLPWLHAAMSQLNMLGMFQEASLVAARVSTKMGFYTEKDDAIPTSTTTMADDTDEDGNPIYEMTPGEIVKLPKIT